MKIPFDIKYRPQIESGEYKVETRDGKNVRVLCYDANNIVPIVALVTFNDGSEGSRDYYLNGTINYDRENPLDLFIITPEEEMTEFEKAVGLVFTDAQLIPRDKDGIANIHDINEFIKKKAAELLTIVKKELQPEIDAEIEKAYKTQDDVVFHKGWEQGKEEVLKDLERTSECNPDKLPKWLKDIKFKAFKRGYNKGYKDASKLHSAPSFIPYPLLYQSRPLCYEPGGTCTNPQMDCINCPRRTGGGFNTASGTSTATMHGNTSATDGKDHNPSFTD